MTTICSLAVVAASLLVVQFISFSTAGGYFPAEVCDQPKDPGPCKAHIERYYYDKKMGICRSLIWGGCEGNENNFATMEKCELMCKPAVRCSASPKAGPCEAYMPRYYYDQKTRTCKEFIYGGCQANGNNFLTKEDCERTCRSAKTTSPMWDYFRMLSLDDEHMFS
ncbi:BPTI/Kunitz domain-containing protein-like [Lithobates pipiens]